MKSISSGSSTSFKSAGTEDSGDPRKRQNEVLPGLEPGLQGSKPWVLTNYTIEPYRGRERVLVYSFEISSWHTSAWQTSLSDV